MKEKKLLITPVCDEFCLTLKKHGFLSLLVAEKEQIKKFLKTEKISVLMFFLKEQDAFLLKHILKENFVKIGLILKEDLKKIFVQKTILKLTDFVVLPATFEEIKLRVDKFLNGKKKEKILEKNQLKIDLKNYELFVAKEKKKVSPKELELLFKLAFFENTLFTREQLLEDVWGYRYIGKTRTVDVHIKKLRNKLKPIKRFYKIETVWGVGYIFKKVY